MKLQPLLRAFGFPLLLILSAPLAAQAPLGKTVPTFLVYYGGGPALTAADAPRLAKFDLIDIDRFRYADIAPNTWAAVKALNPALQFYLYEMGGEAPNYLDAAATVSLNGLGRYNVSRGHSMGSLNGNHPELFLLDASGNRIYNTWFSNTGANQYWHLMDFGSPAYQAYWVEAVRTDIANQPWAADGVHADNCLTVAAAGGYSAVSTKYPSDTAWTNAMNSFAAAASAGLHGYGQKLWCNRGSTNLAVGAAAWRSLDTAATPPDVVGEEGAFAVTWGPWSTQFYAEADWKRQVDTIGSIANSKVAVFSHTALGEGQSGTDNWGRPVTYWQTLWYALGSFLLAKNGALNNAYFNFSGNGGAYNRIWWYPEYELIDLGQPVGNYTVAAVGGVNVYRREFEKGYVYVNPTATDAASVSLPQLAKLLNHDNLATPLSNLPDVGNFALGAHAAVIAVKSSLPAADSTPPSVPAGLAAVAASSAQVNLTWSASTDNVAVTGYYVYLNDAPLTTTSATSFQHTGLAAGTTYNYRVSAFDAVPNHSAWTATPVSVTTPPLAPPPDITAPSIPAGLVATAASSTHVNLAWGAATDNVGVTGYRVYRAGALVATTAALSYADAGLAASTSYSYSVAAFDAAGNASAPSAIASATTPAPLDTSAPGIPAGLAALATSASQINLNWNASADNVGVAGYRVFRGGAQIAITTLPSYVNTGLAASTTYSYTVSAFDAAGNISAQSAIVTARTPAKADNKAPSVPGGLSATAATSRLINLKWSASTDNVGVSGYKVFRGGVQIATVGTPAYGDATVSPATAYSYSVAAFDAAGNTSSKSAARSATTPAARTRGDFDGDGRADILWRDGATGQDLIWFMNGGALLPSSGAASPLADLNWAIAGVGDFNGDGKADVLWRNRATGENTLWIMNGTTIASSAPLSTVADLNWAIAGVGDFNGDGKADILWRNRASGENMLWLMNGAALTASVALTPAFDVNWTIAGVGDFDGNGKADIVWRHAATGEDIVWLMNGATVLSVTTIDQVADLNWSIAGVGDFDGDGKADLLWRNRLTGDNAIYFMNGAAVRSVGAIRPITDLNWSVAGVGDFDGDGKCDVLWRNGATNEDGVYLMDGGTVSAVIYLPTLPAGSWLSSLR